MAVDSLFAGAFRNWSPGRPCIVAINDAIRIDASDTTVPAAAAAQTWVPSIRTAIAHRTVPAKPEFRIFDAIIPTATAFEVDRDTDCVVVGLRLWSSRVGRANQNCASECRNEGKALRARHHHSAAFATRAWARIASRISTILNGWPVTFVSDSTGISMRSRMSVASWPMFISGTSTRS